MFVGHDYKKHTTIHKIIHTVTCIKDNEMNYLQYTSKEMYSSTELIRKSKMIFEKLNKNEIEKAVILRDGKPSFMLLDFESYEKIMEEYISLKEHFEKSKQEVKKVKPQETKSEPKKCEKEIEEEELQKALQQIDDMNFDDYGESSNIIADVIIEERPIEENPDKSLKEFWD